jgi:kynurenine formamidase
VSEDPGVNEPTLLSHRGEWPNQFGNWNRWPGHDGTLNLLSPSAVVKAAATIRTGQAFNCARPLSIVSNASEFSHHMTSVGEFRPGRQAAMDRVELDLHSIVNTHLDALSHVGHQGSGFNGIDFDAMFDAERHRAVIASIDTMPPIVARAVLVDVARDRGVEYLEPGDFVRPDDLEQVATELDPGDVLLVRTGRWSAPRRLPGDPGASGEPLGDWAGLHIDCMSLIADRDVAMLGTDSTTDTFPSPTPDSPSVHMLAEVYLGMPLLHSMDLDPVAAACAEQGRREFFFCVAPLKITGGTGSPVAPVCVL